ncbi:MAG: hypothetical protein LBN27_12305 [Prevotellaceae bacterium]|jgi:hypothetical protein|nr:hypothetical protein [Prevotellaceae bacterium]
MQNEKKGVVPTISISQNGKAEKEQGATGATVTNGTKIAEVTKSTEQVATVPAVPSIQELTAKAEKTAMLVQKYEKIKAKKEQVDRFVILHESEQANIVITDVKGQRIETSNPKSIEQVLAIWKADICEALTNAEQEIRDIMSVPQAMTNVIRQAA